MLAHKAKIMSNSGPCSTNSDHRTSLSIAKLKTLLFAYLPAPGRTISQSHSCTVPLCVDSLYWYIQLFGIVWHVTSSCR